MKELQHLFVPDSLQSESYGQW